jgi:hypothetical protein
VARQRPDRLALALEAAKGGIVGLGRRVHDLEGDGPAEPGLDGAVDGREAAAPDDLVDLKSLDLRQTASTT